MCDINGILLVSFISVKMTLKYKLGRSVLEKYILLLSDLCFEYGCVVWDNTPRHEYLFNEREKTHATYSSVTLTLIMGIIFDIITCSLFILKQKHFDHPFSLLRSDYGTNSITQ